MLSRQSLLTLLASLGISMRLFEHGPIASSEEADAVRRRLGGLLCKCLFLKSAEELYWLAAVPVDMRVDLKRMAGILACGRLTFASPGELRLLLGLAPGSVSVLAAANDDGNKVRVVLEASLLRAETPLLFHPLDSAATVAISPPDLLRFLEHVGHPPALVSGIAG